MKQFKVGDVVIVPADDVLGTDEFKAEIISIESFGYWVKCEDGFEGPVGKSLEILQENI